MTGWPVIDRALFPIVLTNRDTDENGSDGVSGSTPVADSRVSRRRWSKVRARSSQGRKTPTDSYDVYIHSDAWRLSPARLAELLASDGRCRICNDGGSTTILHVHHRTYERLGCELADDLTTLCEPCHVVVTAMQRERAAARRSLPDPIDLPTSGNRTLVDNLEGRP